MRRHKANFVNWSVVTASGHSALLLPFGPHNSFVVYII